MALSENQSIDLLWRYNYFSSPIKTKHEYFT